MKISKQQLSRIIKEETSRALSEAAREEQMARLKDAIEEVVDDLPGIEGMEVVGQVQQHPDGPGPAMGGQGQRDIFAAMDEMLEDGLLFFDEEEDAWFTREEDLHAFRKGGTWSDQQDYEAGFKR